MSKARFGSALLIVAGLASMIWLLFRCDRSIQTANAPADGNLSSLPSPAALQAHANPGAEAAPERTTVHEPAFSELPAPEAPLPEQTLLFGALLDEASELIHGRWYAGVGLVNESGVKLYASAEKDGHYAFPALEFGSYWATAGAEGYRARTERIEFLPETPSLRKDFILSKAVALKIRLVTPDGADLFSVLREMDAPMGARLLVPVATREAPGQRFSEVIGSLNNHFGAGTFWNYGPRVKELPPGYWGILVLDGDLPAWVSLVHYHVVLASQHVPTGQEEVRFVIAPEDLIAGLATLRIQVTDAEYGSPIPGARVSLEGGASYGPPVMTDESGIAVIARREPGEYELHVAASGYERFRRSIDAPPGVTTDCGVVSLGREVVVHGRVVDLEGRPRKESFIIGCMDERAGGFRWFRNEGFQSGDDGYFKIHGLGRREYLIRSKNLDAMNRRDHGGVTWVLGVTSLDARAAAVSGIEFRLQPAVRLVLRVDEELGMGARFRILDERGVELIASRFYGPGSRPLDLPGGTYRVVLLDEAQHVLSEHSVTLVDDAVTLELDQE